MIRSANAGYLKIVFVCGSIEPGRDGVGDYTRLLSSELTRTGHVIAMIGLYDRNVSAEAVGEEQVSGGSIKTLRIPVSAALSVRTNRAQEFVSGFNPDLVSLQFVPFAFHDKGLPYWLKANLRTIIQGRPLHIMFHEIWVGLYRGAGAKNRMLGLFQKFLITSFARKLHPVLIHTQSRLYLLELQQIRLQVSPLPLFSNIITTGLPAGVMQQMKRNRQYELVFIVFGTIHPGAPVALFAAELATLKSKSGVNVIIRFIGRNGAELPVWTEVFSLADIETIVYGEQPASRISDLVRTSDRGISTTCFALSDKSGTVATFLDHGLNVICVAKEWIPRYGAFTPVLPGVNNYIPGKLEIILAERPLEQAPATVVSTAKLLEAGLRKSLKKIQPE